MKGNTRIIREHQATIGRYSLDTGSDQPAIISYTRPRAGVIYLTFARIDGGKAGKAQARALIDAVIEDARANNNRIVLANRQVEEMFGTDPHLQAHRVA
ncbi:MAG: hypothetical protein CME88_04875 [Hirschia sp.]|nr:hypothetical protein [Hirschia sp.]MBF17696.1 hypothetical protein [Hirschia sp.]|tara:strand:- start:311 stop:607 length:297 start_codon:yes stop_codon:yes gene_type:complete